MSNKVLQSTTWRKDLSAHVGRNVQQRRKDLGITATALSERCRNLGFLIHRVTITKIETDQRDGIDLAELIGLAEALEISPLELLTGSEDFRYLPRQTISNQEAAVRFSGLPLGNAYSAAAVALSAIQALQRALEQAATAVTLSRCPRI